MTLYPHDYPQSYKKYILVIDVAAKYAGVPTARVFTVFIAHE
jgi:hypothetical protein